MDELLAKDNSYKLISKTNENKKENEMNKIEIYENIKNYSSNENINNIYNNIPPLHTIIKYKTRKCCDCLVNKFLIKYKFKEPIAIILSLLALFFYWKGLEGCTEKDSENLTNIGIEFFYKIIFANLISIISFSFVLSLSLHKLISKLHLFYLLPGMLYLFSIDQGTTLEHHGYYNTLGYILLTILAFLLCFFIVYIAKIIYYQKRLKLFFISAICLAGFIFSYIKIKTNTKCIDWELGLNNTRIEYDEKFNHNLCNILIPKKCYINLVDGHIDFTKIFGLKCDKRSIEEKNTLFNYIKKNNNNNIRINTVKIGYPLLNQGRYSPLEQEGMSKLSKDIMKNLIDMDNIPDDIKPNEIPEVYIDFTKDPYDTSSEYGKVIINLRKNNELISERKKLENENNVFFNNALIIYIDALSRAHIKRKMPKLTSWIEKYMKYDNDEYFMAYQFLKYHSLGPYTKINEIPNYFGSTINILKGTNIIKDFKQKGFITGQASNFCSQEHFEIYGESDFNLDFDNYDHEFVSLFCDPNYFTPEYPFPINRGAYSSIRRCLYGKDTYEYILNYANQFWNTYKDNRKFFRLGSMDSHEGTGETVKYFDEPLTNFLDNLYKNELLKDTAIFIFSDYGNNHLAGLLSLLQTDDINIEKTMPMFFILIPRKIHNTDFKEEYYKNIYKNQQSFITGYDIYETFKHIANPNLFNDKNIDNLTNRNSLFNYINNKERSCYNYPEIFLNKSPGTLTCACLAKNQKRNDL